LTVFAQLLLYHFILLSESTFLFHYPIGAFRRKAVYKNEVFPTLDKVIDRLCETILSLTADVIKSITGHSWILQLF